MKEERLYYPRTDRAVRAIRYDGTHRMAKEIEALGESPYCEYEDEEETIVDALVAVHYDNTVKGRFERVSMGDYLVWDEDEFMLLLWYKDEFEAMYNTENK